MRIGGGKDVSIHAPRAGRDAGLTCGITGACPVSIHAPRAGRDTAFDILINELGRFNPRAPCGARRALADPHAVCVEFQSTRPVRGATIALGRLCHLEKFQSTRPVRGATPFLLLQEYINTVSIHAPRAGRDLARYAAIANNLTFQSTRPVRGATSSFSVSQCR